MITRIDIINSARKHLKTPFKHMGRSAGLNLDCGGLIIEICKDFGFPYIDIPVYGRVPFNRLMETHLSNQPCLRLIQKSEMNIADVALMRIKIEPQHLGLITPIGLIHCHEDSDGVVEHVLDDNWSKRIVRVYRFIGVDQ